tara:strand:+ start:1304 stop:2011 length:708 start_codon:yes stop_codon:yes gene_type:complete
MFLDTTYRSKEIEIMDDLEMSGDLLINTLDKLGNINKWLGGNKVALDGVKILLDKMPKDKVISIVDLGCGHGDILRRLAKFGRKNGYQFQLVGIDANQAAIDYGVQLSADYPEISYQKLDVLSAEFDHHQYDIAVCTLFLHHFEDDIALKFVQALLKNAQVGVLINDLHRHWMAYYLFKFLTLFINNHMINQDGLTSILKAFKRKDLEKFAIKLHGKSTISWRWAFRYQWIISKI